MLMKITVLLWQLRLLVRKYIQFDPGCTSGGETNCVTARLQYPVRLLSDVRLLVESGLGVDDGLKGGHCPYKSSRHWSQPLYKKCEVIVFKIPTASAKCPFP